MARSRSTGEVPSSRRTTRLIIVHLLPRFIVTGIVDASTPGTRKGVSLMSATVLPATLQTLWPASDKTAA